VNKENLQSTNARPDLYGNLVGGLANESRSHDDLMVYIGKVLNFSTPQYQKRDLLMDFENRDSLTLQACKICMAWIFFESLNMSFAQNCLIVSNGSSYCSNFNTHRIFSKR